jgi:hypothetical protein
VYETPSGRYGFRPNRFAYQVGDNLRTPDGSELSKVIKIIEDSPYARKRLVDVIQRVDRYTKGVEQISTQRAQLYGISLKVKCVTGIKVWKSHEARRDYFLQSIVSL